MSKHKNEADHQATTTAAKSSKSTHAGKSPAHSRKQANGAIPDSAKRARPKRPPTSFADLIQVGWDRWLVVADERDLAGTAKLATQALASTGRIFLMKGEVVELTFRKNGSWSGVRVLDQDGMATALAATSESVAFDRATGRLKPGPSHAQLAQLIAIYRPYIELPVLKGIVAGAANRPDGTAITESGYDDASKLYLVDVNADVAHFDQAQITGDPELDALLAGLA